MRVVVIGGGIVGCCIAHRLAKQGAQVHLLEAEAQGGTTSRAAAGLLTPWCEAHGQGPGLELGLASLRAYPSFVAELAAESGLPLKLSSAPVLRVGTSDEEVATLAKDLAWQRARHTELSRSTLRQREPNLQAAGGWLSEGEASVDPRVLLPALEIAAGRHGVSRSRGAALRLRLERGAVRGVHTQQGEALEADLVVIAAGAFSAALLGQVGLPADAVTPVRGQLLVLAPRPPALRHVIFAPGLYLLPRADGTLLAGATEEHTSFELVVTAGGVADLAGRAAHLVPALRDAGFVEARVGLRPATPDGLPLLGGLPDLPGLLVATGTFRSGILMAPLVGTIIAQLAQGRDPGIDLTPFAPARLLVGPPC